MLCTFDQFSEQRHGPEAGGKGATLARLYQASYPVPNGFIVLCTAFDDNGLMQNAKAPVLAAYHQLLDTSGKTAVAVRSSAQAEDSTNASYAGEFESVLNVNSESAFFNAIAQVFASSKSERVKHYTEALNSISPPTTPSTGQSIAVVVQLMLAPSYSGVLFTTDPISQNPDIMQGNLAEGLGDKLVAGEITGQAFTLHSPTGAYQGPDSFKPYQQQLFQLALKLVNELHGPQDIEWAVEHDTLYVLQSRPITNLSPVETPSTAYQPPEVWNDSLKGNYLWGNTNVGEVFGNVISPFTWSVYQETVQRSIGSVGKHSMEGLIAGRCYLNISLFFAIQKKLGKSRQDIVNSFNLFLGDVPDYVEIPEVSVSWPEVIGFFTGQIGFAMKHLFSLKRHLKWLDEECPAWCEEKFNAIDQCRTNQDLIKLLTGIETVIFKTFAIVGIVSHQFSQHQYKLKPALSAVLDAEDTEIMLSGLIGEAQQLKSMGPLMGIAAVAKGEMSQQQFVQQYGHRGPDEAEYAAPRTAEDPDWINKLITQWQDADLEGLLDKQKQKRQRIWQSLERLPAKKSRKLRQLFSSASTYAHNREQVKCESFRQTWVMRKFIQKAALINQQPADALFYLRKDEFVRFLHGNTTVLDNIKPRQDSYKAYSALPAVPSLITGRIEPFQWANDPQRRTDYYNARQPQAHYDGDDKNIIKGFAGSSGLIEGTVRVLCSHDQIDEFVSGEILVTSFTNVGWTPLFPRAAAIITDIGAPLSHAAIVARELGIPAVVGTGFATMKLKTGDKVKVNGSAGLVEMLT